MNHVRLLLDSTQILMAGYSDFTGLFDTEMFEQIEGYPPENSEMMIIKSATSQLLQEYKLLPLDIRTKYYSFMIKFTQAYNGQDKEAAKQMLIDLDVPEDFEFFRQRVLIALFPEA